jgi:hypothetical protein
LGFERRGYLPPFFVLAPKVVINAARSLGKAIKLARHGMLEDPGRGLVEPKPK